MDKRGLPCTMLRVVAIVAVAAHCIAGVNAGELDHIIRIRSSVNNTTKITNNGTLVVPHSKHGYLLCDASGVYESLTPTTHYWDYYVEWEMPKEAQDDDAVFQMGNEYQMPHSYLVFRGFKSNFTGRYQCRLHFRNTLVGSLAVHLTL